ncbi:MAG: hypothetical protein RLZZ367_2469 [Bacteroidota bacterium]|jgi:pimeloyl-ACP methyl ester carboxylesterase
MFKRSKNFPSSPPVMKPLLTDIAFTRTDNYPGRPTIVFLHDSLGCITLWRDFPEKLGALTNCNVLVYDRQGYGKSCPFAYTERDALYMEHEADILMDLLQLWGIQQPILFGHSDGGSIALIAAGKYPGKIAAVITEGAHVFVEDITVAGIKQAAEQYRTTNLKQKLEKYHGTNTEAMFWAWAATWVTPAFANWNIEHFLPAVQCPVLVMQGTDDEYGTLAQVESITTKTKGSSSAFILPHVKHTPHKEAPDAVLQRAAAFIKQIV